MAERLAKRCHAVQALCVLAVEALEPLIRLIGAHSDLIHRRLDPLVETADLIFVKSPLITKASILAQGSKDGAVALRGLTCSSFWRCGHYTIKKMGVGADWDNEIHLRDPPPSGGRDTGQEKGSHVT